METKAERDKLLIRQMEDRKVPEGSSVSSLSL